MNLLSFLHMGIDPTEDDVTNECPLCFPVGKTPKNLWASFTGLKRGSLWTSAHGTVPNRVYKLHNDGGCNWSSLSGGRTVTWGTGFGESLVRIRGPGFHLYFGSRVTSLCAVFFPNELTNPVGTYFYGGSCAISMTAPSIGSSLLRPMELLNLPVEPKTFAEVFPIDNTTNVYRYARKKDGTKILIKFDYTA